MINRITELTVIIPVYNEKATILDLLQRVPTVDIGRLDKEIIVVDDGSTDGTTDLLENAGNILVIKQPLNMGKGSAIRTGLERAAGEIGLTFVTKLAFSRCQHH